MHVFKRGSPPTGGPAAVAALALLALLAGNNTVADMALGRFGLCAHERMMESQPSMPCMPVGCPQHSRACTAAKESLGALSNLLRDQKADETRPNATQDATKHLNRLGQFVGHFCPPALSSDVSEGKTSATEQQPPSQPAKRHRTDAFEMPIPEGHGTAVVRERRADSPTIPSPRAPVKTTVTCTIYRDSGACSPIAHAYELEFVFQSNDEPEAGIVDIEEKLASLTATVRPSKLTIHGPVHASQLSTLLGVDWNTVSTIFIDNLQDTELDLAYFRRLPALKAIEVANGLVSRIHAGSGAGTAGAVNVTQIEALRVSNNGLSTIDTSLLGLMPNLVTLDWSKNQVPALPPGVFSSVPKLQNISLTKNRLSSLDLGAFEGLHDLTTLDISNNGVLTVSPSVFAPLASLIHLNLENNALERLPSTLLATLTQLRELKLSNTRLQTLQPDTFVANTRLRMLYLDHNLLTQPHSAALQPLRALSTLVLTANELTSLPANQFQTLHSLGELDLASNNINSVDGDAFQGLRNLTTLNLHDNAITQLYAETFRPTTRLSAVDVSLNEIATVPNSLFANCLEIQTVILSDNKLTVFDHRPLPTLSHLRLADNPIVMQPDVHKFRNLTFLLMNGHRISQLDFGTFFGLLELHTLQAAADPEFGNSSALPSFPEQTTDRVLSVRALDISHVRLPGELAAKVQHAKFRLKRFAAGFPGMSEENVPIKVLCNLLDDDVEEFALTNTGYSNVSLCPDKTFRAVFLTRNEQLERVEIPTPLEQLNLYRSSQLTDLVVPRVDIVDLSYTKVKQIVPLCVEWGSTALIYRGVTNSLLDSFGADLVHRCLQRVEHADFSNSDWLIQIRELQTNLRLPTVLSSSQFENDGHRSVQSRPEAPTLTVLRSPINCRVSFQNEQVRPTANPELLQTRLTYRFECSCSGGYHQSGNVCVPNSDKAREIAFGVSFSSVAVVAIVIIAVQYRRRKRLARHRDELAVELKALHRAMDISYDDLELKGTVGGGALGGVSIARWKGSMVAVKTLHVAMKELDESTVEAFAKEIDFFKKTHHPNLVRFFGAGKTRDGLPFLVLEYAALGSLNNILHKRTLRDLLYNPPWLESLVLIDNVEVASRNGSVSSSRETKLGDSLREPLLPDHTEHLQHQQQHQEHQEQQYTEDDQTFQNTWRAPGDTLQERSMADESLSTHEPGSVQALKLRFARDIASGMTFLHEKGFVHRDLKSDNVLVSSELRAMITDFGSIYQLQEVTRGDVDGVEDEDEEEDVQGTPIYMAPEALQGSPSGPEVDVFSFGVLLWELTMEQVPDLLEQEGVEAKLGGRDVQLELLQQGRRLRFPDNLDDPICAQLAALSKKCVVHDPHDRPSFQTLLRDLDAAAQQQNAEDEMDGGDGASTHV